MPSALWPPWERPTSALRGARGPALWNGQGRRNEHFALWPPYGMASLALRGARGPAGAPPYGTAREMSILLSGCPMERPILALLVALWNGPFWPSVGPRALRGPRNEHFALWPPYVTTHVGPP